MFKRLVLSFGIVSITTLAVYTVRLHRDNQVLIETAENMIDLFEQHVTDFEFAEIVEGLGDIDN